MQLFFHSLAESGRTMNASDLANKYFCTKECERRNDKAKQALHQNIFSSPKLEGNTHEPQKGCAAELQQSEELRDCCQNLIADRAVLEQAGVEVCFQPNVIHRSEE